MSLPGAALCLLVHSQTLHQIQTVLMELANIISGLMNDDSH